MRVPYRSVGDNVPALVTYPSVMTTFCVCCRDGVAVWVCGLSYEVNDGLQLWPQCINNLVLVFVVSVCEPVWLSGKALGW